MGKRCKEVADRLSMEVRWNDEKENNRIGTNDHNGAFGGL